MGMQSVMRLVTEKEQAEGKVTVLRNALEAAKEFLISDFDAGLMAAMEDGILEPDSETGMIEPDGKYAQLMKQIDEALKAARA